MQRSQLGTAWSIGARLALAGTLVLLMADLLRVAPAAAAERFITLASTTSTENSGLFGHLLPLFTAETGIAVRVVAVGTGQAMRLGRRGDADALLVHHRPSEDAFVKGGFGLWRRDVMYNDYVLVGPAADPAGIAGGRDVKAALKRIAGSGAPFASRGDNSGTHLAEQALWQAAGFTPGPGLGAWYRETGSGMGPTLNTAAAMDAYALADRGTWLSFRNRRDLRILVEGDPPLFNPYAVIVVNPARFPHIKVADATAFADWITSTRGQQAIGAFKINGEMLFFPDARSVGR